MSGYVLILIFIAILILAAVAVFFGSILNALRRATGSKESKDPLTLGFRFMGVVVGGFIVLVIAAIIFDANSNKSKKTEQETQAKKKSVFGDYDPLKDVKEPIFESPNLKKVIGDADADMSEKFVVICEWKNSYKVKSEKNGKIGYIRKGHVNLMSIANRIINDLDKIPSCEGSKNDNIKIEKAKDDDYG